VHLQPRVDAADVEEVPALGQAPHHLAAAKVLQAHGARRHSVSSAARGRGGAVLLLVRGLGQRADVYFGKPAAHDSAGSRGGGGKRRAGASGSRTTRRGRDDAGQAPGGAGDEHGGQGDEGARLPDDDGRGEHARRGEQRAGLPRHGCQAAVAAAEDVVDIDDRLAGEHRRRRVQPWHDRYK